MNRGPLLLAIASLGWVEPAPAPAEAHRPAGQVVDARTGSPLSGVSVRATYSESDDGYPPLLEQGSRYSTRTDAGGRFRLPPFRMEDPRLKLHLEADHPGFLPAALVVEDEPDFHGRPFVTLRLRRARTRRVLFLDPDDRPLPDLPVEVKDLEEDSFLGEDSFEEGRMLRPDRPSIRYTRSDGTLRLPERVMALTPRHPSLYLWDVSPPRAVSDPEVAARLPSPSSTFTLDLRPDRRPEGSRESEVILQTKSGEPKEYRVQDLGGTPAADSLIEIDLEGMAPVRLYTDRRGSFAFAPMPFGSKEEFPLSRSHPRRGTLTVLSPLLWKRSTPLALPSPLDLLRVQGRSGGRITFRLKEALGEGAARPVPAERVRISEEMTVVRRTAGGEVELEGPLPKGGTLLTLAITGYLPEELRIPPHLPGTLALELGDVVLERGGSFSLQLAGGSPANWEEARLLIAEKERASYLQEYLFDRKGRVEVGGLLEGRAYLYAIQGPSIERVEGELLLTEELSKKGLIVPVVSAEEGERSLTGQAVGVSPEHCSSYRVLERYFLSSKEDPLIFLSYPLAPDGLIGSRRFLPALRRAEVFLVGPGHRVGYAMRALPPGTSELDMGRIVPRESYHAIFSFKVEGLGKVSLPRPPSLTRRAGTGEVTLFAEEDRNHLIARMSREDRSLLIENLRPGRYHLRWGGKDEEEETFSFLVRPEELEITGEIPRKPALREEVEFRVADGEGNPVEGARILEESLDPVLTGAELGTGGRYRKVITPREENRFRVLAEGFLTVQVVLPPRARFPDPIVLKRGARVWAQVRDADRRRYDGELWITFDAEASGPGEGSRGEPVVPEATLIHGEPMAVAVKEGVLDSQRFPPGRTRIMFRIPSSEAKVEGTYELAEKRINDVGTLVLKETRSLGGAVFLPGGLPAGEAVVSLVKPEKAYRFPGRPEDPQVKYRVRADALGRFRIDGLPLDLTEELALVAHLDGWTDAVEDPLNLHLEEHNLVLDLETGLGLDVGYDQDGDHQDYLFHLEHLGGPGAPGQVRDLGPLEPGRRGGSFHRGITPGVYRVLWSLREAHPAIAPRSAEALAAPGAPAMLSLRVAERVVSGQAYFNRELLESGWILLLTARTLEDPGELWIGRVKGGTFRVPVPIRAERGYAALIPEEKPPAAPNFFRGEALPREVKDFRSAVKRGFLYVEYQAHDLTVILPARFLSQGDSQIEFPHYFPHSGGYRRESRREPLAENPFRLRLIPPGSFSLRISGRGGSYLIQNMEINRDTTINLGD